MGRDMVLSSVMRGGVVVSCWRQIESGGVGAMGPVAGWGEE